MIPSININGQDLTRRDSIHITIFPRERRIPSIQRARSVGKDDRLPPFPRYRVEVLPKKAPPAPVNPIKPLQRESSLKDRSVSKGLHRDGSTKRVTIDPSVTQNPSEDATASPPPASPRNLQRQRQMNWHRRRKSSNGSYKASIDDSISQSLMTSFDISGRADVDSTSCSVCSSDEVSNLTSSAGNGAQNNGLGGAGGGVSPRNIIKGISNLPRQCPLEDPLDESEATLASSNDSFTIESVPPDISGDSSSLSEAAANLPPPPSPRLSRFPQRQDRQIRSMHGLRPRPRPSVTKTPLSSSLNELPQYHRRTAAEETAPESPELRNERRSSSQNTSAMSDANGDSLKSEPQFHSWQGS